MLQSASCLSKTSPTTIQTHTSSSSGDGIICKSNGTLTCGACHAVKYCSPECQGRDWKCKHERLCNLLNIVRGIVECPKPGTERKTTLYLSEYGTIDGDDFALILKYIPNFYVKLLSVFKDDRDMEVNMHTMHSLAPSILSKIFQKVESGRKSMKLVRIASWSLSSAVQRLG